MIILMDKRLKYIDYITQKRCHKIEIMLSKA